MLRNILRYIARTLGVVLFLVLLCVALLYVPAVQDFVRRKAVGYASRTLGADVSVGRLRIGFPLRIVVERASVVERADTLVAVERLSADVALGPLLHKEIAVRRFRLEGLAGHYRDSAMLLSLRLADAEVADCRIGWRDRTVAVASVSLEHGAYGYTSIAPRPEREREPSEPWSIRIARIVLTDQRATYAQAGHRPEAGFDPRFVVVEGLDAEVDSLYSRGSDLALDLRHLAFSERCGLAVRDVSGRFVRNEHGLELSGFALQTLRSSLQAEARVAAGALQGQGDAPFSVGLSAGLNTDDAALLFPHMLPEGWDDRFVRVQATAAGSGTDLDRLGVEVAMPGYFQLTADAEGSDLTDSLRRKVSVRFRGELTDPAFLLPMAIDSALRGRVALPGPIGLSGSAALERRVATGEARWTLGTGVLALDGRYALPERAYEVALRSEAFPVGRFLPRDSLGLFDFSVRAQGRGFDPLAAATRADVRVRIDRAEYRGRDFGGMELDATLVDGQLVGRWVDRSDALKLDWNFTGELAPQRLRIAVSGRVSEFDLAALGVGPDSLGGSFAVDAEVVVAQPRQYAGRIDLDSVVLRTPRQRLEIGAAAASLVADSVRVALGASTGDCSLSFEAAGPLDSLIAAVTRSRAVIERQIRDRNLDMLRLQAALPTFALRASVGRENVFHSVLGPRGIAFDTLRIEGGNGPQRPFTLRLDAIRPAVNTFVLDTLSAAFRQDSARLEYALRADRVPAGQSRAAVATLYGEVAGRTAQAHFGQRSPAGREEFRVGLDLAWTDDSIRASVTPLEPVFGAGTWTVNAGNYVAYRFGGGVEADLTLTQGPKQLTVQTVPEGLRLGARGLDIGAMLAVLPAAPPVAGVLGVDASMLRSADTLSVRGDVSVAGLTYDGRRFGDLEIEAHYVRGRDSNFGGRVSLDGTTVVSARGDYRADRAVPLDAAVEVVGFPLQRIDAFFPDDAVRLAGTLQGGVRAVGPLDRLRLDGGVRFVGTEVRVPMIGTTFRLSSDSIRLVDGRVRFDRYALLAPDGSRLVIDGAIDLDGLRRPMADLTVQAADFCVVDVARSAGTSVYGTAYLDLDVAVRGALNAPVVRGNVALLGDTDLTYVMRKGPVSLSERPRQVVTFVSFEELAARRPAPPKRTLRSGGADLLLQVDVHEDVEVAVDLSEDGANRAELRGGGSMTFVLNPLGDVRFTGRYAISGGVVRYTPPVIAQKVFRIRPGGYVEWMGDIADPTFRITAVETVRANVSIEGEPTRPVNFEVSIEVRNTLTDLSVVFSLAAPEDLALQNQLNSLTAEQRANQAMNLLIYNTYTGPGTTARAASENPLNTFIERELNQWAQNNLRGVDLSFGIRSYDADDPNGSHTDYSYRLSKNLFGNRFRAVIGGRISTDADPSENLRENLIDDISLEYMLTRRDNIYLRVFRHTGYESILEGEITETGVGFVIRKKLARLGDLFRFARRAAEKPTDDGQTAQ